MTGNGYTKQGTSSPAIGCETAVAKSSFSGTNPFFPFLLGGVGGSDCSIAELLYHITFLVNTIHPSNVYIYIKYIQ